ncbi:MAG: hypothetical protein HRU28_08505 [Rhizobiales bacterium]|nr:hypothetical protein [Hyphomicrobiales bacterium]
MKNCFYIFLFYAFSLTAQTVVVAVGGVFWIFGKAVDLTIKKLIKKDIE